MGKNKKRHSDIGPFENRRKCRVCGSKGTIKIVVNSENREIIKRHLNSKYVMYFMEMDNNNIECYCQDCGDFRFYPLSSDLFSDGIIKEI